MIAIHLCLSIIAIIAIKLRVQVLASICHAALVPSLLELAPCCTLVLHFHLSSKATDCDRF